jgi:hypothetical protein
MSFCESRNMKMFRCFPLRTSWIPANIQLDTKILKHNILNVPDNRFEDKMVAWDVVVQRSRKAFKAQGHHRMCWFRGTMYTDGVSATIIKTDEETRAGGARKSSSKMAQDAVILKSSHQSNCASSIIDVSSSTLDEGIWSMACMKVVHRIGA